MCREKNKKERVRAVDVVAHAFLFFLYTCGRSSCGSLVVLEGMPTHGPDRLEGIHILAEPSGPLVREGTPDPYWVMPSEIVLQPAQEAEEASPVPLLSGVPGLRLTQVERRAVEELVSGQPGITADFVAQRAAAFAGDPSGETRRRSLSKAAAIQEALMAQLTTLLAAAVARRDGEAAKLLDRCLNGATTRFKLLIEELRADFGGKKVTVQVGIVGSTVHLNAGG